ncbi:MAG: hypothetical protein KDB79_10460 [Acidobacteria bacterium]|nr:hypothetical protein [Acidobacteriota bacterium]
MKENEQNEKKSVHDERESAILWQGIIIWIISVGSVILVWFLLFLVIELIIRMVFPSLEYHYIFTIISATVVCAISVYSLKKLVT